MPATSSRLVDQLGVPPAAMPEVYACPVSLSTNNLAQLSIKELKTAQDLDPVIGPVKAAIEAGNVPVSSKTDPPEVALMCRESSKLNIHDGILY